jgi:hypothetical protein
MKAGLRISNTNKEAEQRGKPRAIVGLRNQAPRIYHGGKVTPVTFSRFLFAALTPIRAAFRDASLPNPLVWFELRSFVMAGAR